jgi:hypothetical protein
LKTLLLLFFGLLLFATGAGAQTLKIAGETFHPVDTNSSDAGYLKEYLPAHQTLTDWTKSFGVSSFSRVASPSNYINNLCAAYHRGYPEMKFDSGGQESRNRWFADFLVYPKTPASKYLEWNFFRAQTNATGGIIVFQYTERRAYKKDIKELESWDVTALRRHMLPFLMTNEFAIK